MLSATRPHTLASEIVDGTLPQRLRASAERMPDAEAVVDDQVRLTYRELLDHSSAFASVLRAGGLAPGNVVLIQLPNWWETVVAVWGTWLAGGVVLPVVPIYRAHELTFIIREVDPAVLIAPMTYRGYDHAAELLNLAGGRRVVGVRMDQDVDGVERFESMLEARLGEPDAQPAPDDVALVLYTSGTTSAPKGALHSHRTLLAESLSIRETCRLLAADRIFMPSPLSHITGLSYGIVLPADLGAAAVLLERWDPVAAVEVIEAERCTFTVSATPFLRGLADTYAQRTPSHSALLTFVCGGADIPPELVRRAHATMDTAVVRTYGSTEMPTVAMADPFGDLYAAAEEEGPVIGPNEMLVRADADGLDELLVRGPELFLGYVDAALNEASFTDDGFFRTGDAAAISGGTLRILGRIKDIINRGGEKYSAAEVEWALLAHPAVAEVAIIGMPDEILGERACAFVVPTGVVEPTLDGLREHLLAAGFAVQKSPERLEIVRELPRTASGKVQKFRLREQLGWARLPTERELRA